MRAIDFEDIEIGQNIIIANHGNDGSLTFSIHTVVLKDERDRTIFDGLYNIDPNEDEQYIVLNKF